MADDVKRSRRDLMALCAALAASSVVPSARAANETRPGLLDDFILFQRSLEARYAHWDAVRRTVWSRGLTQWRAKARFARTHAELAPVLQAAADALHDDGILISDHGARPTRRVPADTDVWPAFHGDVATVEAVRASGDADYAGLKPGHVIENVQGVPVARAVDALAGRRALPRDRDWALRRLMAGPWSGKFLVDVRDDGKRARLEIERRPPTPATGNLTGRRIGDNRDLGYIRVVDVDADAADFDIALEPLLETRALLLDLRDPSNGVTRASARAILGRFVKGPSRWLATDSVPPRGPRYVAPVIVLVDRWTAGDAEVLAAALEPVAGARLVGTATAGHTTEPTELLLGASGIRVHFPYRPTWLANGRKLSGESLVPAVLVDPAAPSGGPGDPILYQAMKLGNG